MNIRIMLIAYLKLSLRLLVRNPFFTVINVLGLSVGLTAFFVLWHYSSAELKSDQYHEDYQQIARLGINWNYTDDGVTWRRTVFGAVRSNVVPMVANDFPQVKSFTRVLNQPWFSKDMVGYGNRVVVSTGMKAGQQEVFEETKLAYTDPNFFEFFTIPLISGSRESVLKSANSVTISESIASKYFGNEDAVGRVLTVNDTISLTITGVFRDFPSNSHLSFDWIISNVGMNAFEMDVTTTAYVKLDESLSIRKFETEINKRGEKYFETWLKRYGLIRIEFFVQPLSEIAFSQPLEYENLKLKSKPALLLLQWVSVVILVIAWINYAVLTVSRLSKRSKEIATRKTIGALSFDLTKQFFIESFLTNALAALVALTTMQLIRQPANLLFGFQVPHFGELSASAWTIFVAAFALGVFLTALYPIVISTSGSLNFNLKNSKGGSGRRFFLSFLTVGQYAAALTLILWAFIVSLQLDFILRKDVGLETEEIVVVDGPVVRGDNYASEFAHFMNELRALSEIRSVSYCHILVSDQTVQLFIKRKAESLVVGLDTNGGVDESFIPFYGIKILSGRNFVKDDIRSATILSRFGARRLGFENPEDAVGEKLLVQDEQGEWVNEANVVGVMEDYRFKHYLNISEATTTAATGQGTVLTYQNNMVNRFSPEELTIKVDMDKFPQTLEVIKEKFSQLFPGNFFKWYFLKDHINKAYDGDRIGRNQIVLFTLLAIGISCLGLLATFTNHAEEMTKEIGIRKIAGASLIQIGKVLVGGISRQIIISILIALPISYYLVSQYLNRYLEKITLQWWHFAVPIALMILIMFGTILSVLVKAARRNPVESLRYE